MRNTNLWFYIIIGGSVGLIFGGFWKGIIALVLIYIAQSLNHLTGKA